MVATFDEGVSAGWAVNVDLDMCYVDGDGSVTRRRIAASAIAPRENGDYEIQAFCNLRGEDRTFLISRVIDMCDAQTGEVFAPPVKFVIANAELPEALVAELLQPDWRKIATILLRRIAEVFPLEADSQVMSSVVWGMGKKINAGFRNWHIHDASRDVSDAELKMALYDAALLPPEWRTIIANGLGAFASGTDDWPADHPRRVYARQVRNLLRPMKKPRAIPSLPIELFKGDGTLS